MDNTTKKLQGFAAISIERRREISSMGGTTAQTKGTGYTFTDEDRLKAVARVKEIRKQAETIHDTPPIED